MLHKPDRAVMEPLPEQSVAPVPPRPQPVVRALIVDDEKNIRTTLRFYLESLGSDVVAMSSSAGALTAVEHQHFDIAFVDLRLGSESGLDLIPRLVKESPGLLIVLVTAYATVEAAVDAVRRGAWDYLAKPFEPAQLRHLVDRVIEQRGLRQRVAELESRLAGPATDVDLSSESPRMRAVLETISHVATTDVPVLFRGENGTGKSVLARALHARSSRREAPFVVTNCPTLSEELMASELFGHVRGAFTGAVRDQPGRVETAEGGTLFLDEIGEIPPSIQAKLLRFLQEKDFERLGEPQTRHADVRIIAATNRNLEAEVQAGRFRTDLLYRLNLIEIEVPPLRGRREDILPLARGFLQALARQSRRRAPELSKDAEQVLLNHTWPGNVRELRNAVERALILWPAPLIDAAAFSDKITGNTKFAPMVGGDSTLDEIEKEHILRVMVRARGLSEAARILGIDASTLWRKRKRFDEEGR